MKTKFLLVCIFALLLSACAAPNTPQPAETLPAPEATQPAVTVQASPTSQTLPATPMKTYTDEYAGFSLDYPADWYLEASALAHAEESFGYSVSVASWDILNPPAPTDKNPDALPAGGTKIDMSVLKDSMTLEEAVAQQSQNELGGPIVAQQNVTLANGLPAVILDFDSPIGPVRTLITALNGNIIYVSGYGVLDPFEEIALSFRAR